MINEIYVNDEIVENEIPKKQFRKGFKIRCIKCNELVERKYFSNSILEKKYTCKKCVLLYYNPMFNVDIKKKHSDICKSDKYKNNMSILCSGELNGFYGKTHNEKSIKKIKDGFKSWYSELSKDDYDRWRKNMSDGNIKLMYDKPEFYHNIKSKAARASHISQFLNCEMNKIETIVYDYLKKLNIDVKFSIILGYNQYDFGVKDKRILIEIDGDYWHGNPLLYNIEGTDDKRKLNNEQLDKIEKDIKKNKFALEHNFKLIRIWENEINDGSFIEKLKDII